MKNDYETITLIDILRIIRKWQILFYKSDIKQIVNPSDYIKEYIPDNFGDLSDDEIKKLNIPDYEDLNIYKLPSYEQINHKSIMTSYIKRNVTEKNIRQDLFYALRNDDYLDKFYNNLRKHGLYKEYLDYSKEYYVDVFNAWKQENNVKMN